ncbi:MAG: endolytic transglycosylase MltG [Saprospiraceae bacterium]|nr:endolytic transglycosylase MltG [Saprospiraceae bacterium]
MKKTLFLIFMLVLVVGSLLLYRAYQMIQKPNINPNQGDWTIRIAEDTNLEGLMTHLNGKNILTSPKSFVRVSKWMKFGDHVPAGNYRIDAAMSNRALINLLRSGSQAPVRLTINSVRMLSDLAGKMATQVQADSGELISYLTSPAAQRMFDTNQENVISYFIPNTYEVFWNESPSKLMNRFKEEHARFWNSNGRIERAQSMGYSPEQIYTLASIVEKETYRRDELPVVAGLYLNRLKIGMPLQADPTVVFANKQFDLRRVLNKHLAIDSPYNTYKYAGLPPGPICMPTIEGIDAVLNASEHDYLYMCASTKGGRRHAFAASIEEHGRNARAYHAWLDQQGIR